jgi:hypothetical protein
MKTISAIILGLFLSCTAFAQNANESIPQTYTGVPSMNNITSFYGGQMPASLSEAMKSIHVFESSTDDLLIYPHPVIGMTRIVLHEPSQDFVYVMVIDMNGSILRAFQFNPNSYELQVDMGSLPIGMYSVRVFGNQVSYHNLRVQKN